MLIPTAALIFAALFCYKGLRGKLSLLEMLFLMVLGFVVVYYMLTYLDVFTREAVK